MQLGLTLKSAMNNVKIIRSNKKICSKGGKWHRRPSIKKVSPDGIETKVNYVFSLILVYN